MKNKGMILEFITPVIRVFVVEGSQRRLMVVNRRKR